MVEFVHHQVDFSVEDVVEDPLVVVRKVVVHVQMHFVWQLNDFVVPCRVEVARLKRVKENAFRTQELDLRLNEEFGESVESSEDHHMELEVEA